MNTLENFDEERKTCSNIYEILAHPAVFGPLLICIFPSINIKEFDGIYLGLKNPKTYFLRIEENLNKILTFFKSEKNVKKFADEVEKFYLEHKEALDRAGINDSHKNAYSIAIATLRQFDDNGHIINFNKNISIKPTQSDNIKNRIQNKFEEIVSEIVSNHKIIGDIEGNLVNRINSSDIIDFFDKNVAKIKNFYIDIDTRKPIIINNNKVYWMNNIYLPGGNRIVEVGIDVNGIKIEKYMASETEEYKVEGKEVTSIWDRDNLPNGDEVAQILLENNDTRYVTKENTIYRIPFEGFECEVCNLGELKEISEDGEKGIGAIIIDKNGKERQVLILRYGIRKPTFTLFGKSIFIKLINK